MKIKSQERKQQEERRKSIKKSSIFQLNMIAMIPWVVALTHSLHTFAFQPSQYALSPIKLGLIRKLKSEKNLSYVNQRRTTVHSCMYSFHHAHEHGLSELRFNHMFAYGESIEIESATNCIHVDLSSSKDAGNDEWTRQMKKRSVLSKMKPNSRSPSSNDPSSMSPKSTSLGRLPTNLPSTTLSHIHSEGKYDDSVENLFLRKVNAELFIAKKNDGLYEWMRRTRRLSSSDISPMSSTTTSLGMIPKKFQSMISSERQINKDNDKISPTLSLSMESSPGDLERKDIIESMSSPSSTKSQTSQNILNAAAELTKSSSTLLGNTKSIGVDYGLVRTGIAVSSGYSYTPLNTVSDFNNTQLISHIIKVATLEEATQIVVGLPFHKNGTEAEQTIITRNFTNHLFYATYAQFGPDHMPIYMWDERYTSKEAAARIRAANPRANLYKELDAEAACIILEYYYNDDGLGAQRVTMPDNDEIRMAVEQAWEVRKEEMRREREELTRIRMMDSGDQKKAMMEKARLLEEQLQSEGLGGGGNFKRKKKKKKKKKR